MRVNRKRAREVVRRLDEAFARREGLLAEIEDLVEYQIPVGVRPLSRDHALFLFFTLVNDHGTKSRRLYAKAKELFRSNRGLFEPATVVAQYSVGGVDRLVDDVCGKLGTRYPRVAAITWLENALKLREYYDSDPRRVFRSSQDARDVIGAICDFRGYGPKTGAMLLRAVVGLGFAQLSNVQHVLVPVDIHDSRISFYVGAVEDDGQSTGAHPEYYSHVRDIQALLTRACREEGVAWPDVDRALWLIGSRGCVSRRCAECPLLRYCSVGAAYANVQHPNVKRLVAPGGRRDAPAGTAASRSSRSQRLASNAADGAAS